MEILELLGLTRLERATDTKTGDISRQIVSATNLTIINYILVHFGPMHERNLCLSVGAVQIAASALAFTIRYGVGSLVYGGDRR